MLTVAGISPVHFKTASKLAQELFPRNKVQNLSTTGSDLSKLIEQGSTIVDNIQAINEAKQNGNMKDVLTQIKDFIKNLLDQLSEVNKSLGKKITLDEIQEVVKKVTPSTAMITGAGNAGALGSGVIISDTTGKKYILTNAHVIDGIDENQEEQAVGLYRALLYNGSDYEKPVQHIVSPVMLNENEMAYSSPKEHDLALLEVVSDKGLQSNLGIELRDIHKDPVMPGEVLIAVGSPFGLKDSITFGIASHVNRWAPFNKNTYVQTDTPIGPGNSGGGLFDMKGRLVGINTWAIHNVGGSIRVDEVAKLLDKWNIPMLNASKSQKSRSLSLAA